MQILAALHHLSALKVMDQNEDTAKNLIIGAIISWYYGIYFSSKAMLTACDDTDLEHHIHNAKAWDRQIAQNNLIPYPFSLRISSLVKKDYESYIESLEGYQKGLNLAKIEVNDIVSTKAAYINYLKGTADYYNWLNEEDIRNSSDFKKLNVKDFRTKQARELRDEKLKNLTCSFLHQAFRYRGKTNYRDALFLSYAFSKSNEKYTKWLNSLYTVLYYYLMASSYYCMKRIGRKNWELFIDDLKNNNDLFEDIDVFGFKNK